MADKNDEDEGTVDPKEPVGDHAAEAARARQRLTDEPKGVQVIRKSYAEEGDSPDDQLEAGAGDPAKVGPANADYYRAGNS